jgi:hypothetical protein
VCFLALLRKGKQVKRKLSALWRVKVVALALIIALTLGAASTATGHTGSVGLFHLNHSNTVNAVSTLIGTVSGPVARFHNNNPSGGTALNLQVEPNRPPLTVNSAAGTATDFSADELDGKNSTDFLPNATYSKFETTFGTDLGGGNRLWEVSCDSGDKILSGGYHGVDATGTTVTATVPDNFHQGWYMEWTNNDGTADQISVYAFCANF